MTSTFAPNTPVDADPNDDLTFVRCPTLTHSSMNGQTKGPSSILCDVPHYIQTAKSGWVFYAPAEKTYLKLNNKDKITLNRLRIEVVNSDELLVQDLQRQTTVMLHIKECGCS